MSNRRARPYMVEIVGVAGSGKSTLAGAVCRPTGAFGRLDQMRLRDPGHLVHVTKALPRLLPLMPGTVVHRLDWTDTKLLLYLESWDRFIGRIPEVSPSVIVADQGPVYALARLATQSATLTRVALYRRWWERMITRWSMAVDLIVCLDAADEILAARINEREQGHAVKGGPPADTREFIEVYRSAYEDVITTLESRGHVKVVRLDTSRSEPMALAGEVEAIILTAAAGRN